MVCRWLFVSSRTFVSNFGTPVCVVLCVLVCACVVLYVCFRSSTIVLHQTHSPFTRTCPIFVVSLTKIVHCLTHTRIVAGYILNARSLTRPPFPIQCKTNVSLYPTSTDPKMLEFGELGRATPVHPIDGDFVCMYVDDIHTVHTHVSVPTYTPFCVTTDLAF